jgi:hypothetical protein
MGIYLPNKNPHNLFTKQKPTHLPRSSVATSLSVSEIPKGGGLENFPPTTCKLDFSNVAFCRVIFCY